MYEFSDLSLSAAFRARRCNGDSSGLAESSLGGGGGVMVTGGALCADARNWGTCTSARAGSLAGKPKHPAINSMGQINITACKRHGMRNPGWDRQSRRDSFVRERAGL